MTPQPRPLWQPDPDRVRGSQLFAFMTEVERRWGVPAGDYAALHRFSIEYKERFWRTLWDFAGVRGEGALEPVLERGDRMPGARWFPQMRLSFVENLLAGEPAPDADAIVYRDEAGGRRSLRWSELREQVFRVGSALAELGVGPGDRVAGYVANVPEAMVAMLGALSLGAVWSSCSPDFGVAGVLDRLVQIAPKVLFAVDGYRYGGRTHRIVEKVGEVTARLPGVRQLVWLPNLGVPPREPPAAGVATMRFEELLARGSPGPFKLPRLPFDQPLYILYSSGTTGRPKGIVHGAGGVLLQHLKEHRLHFDVRARDRVFYYTTCGWMMCNWLVSALASGATLLLYDGSPLHPHPAVLFDYADDEGMTLLGVSAKYLDSLRRQRLSPRRSHRLASLRAIASTGSPLAADCFDYVYQDIKQDLQLSSISGGTDIVSCFVLGNPIGPVWRGEIQARGLGMAVQIFDEQGRALPPGGVGELVCTAPFPTMPLRFWNDPDGARYRAAYFERFPGVWHHGDLAELTEHDGVIIHGRSDALLKPGGVRIGTAEIYREVEAIEGIEESLAIGQDWQGDVRVVLFVVLAEGRRLDDDLIERIRATLRERRSPFHVPARVVQVPDLPRTRNGKLSELAVREVVHGRTVRNLDALANPEVLEHFRDRRELQI